MIRKQLADGTLDDMLQMMYCTDKSGVAIYKKRYLDLIDAFEQDFGAGTVRLFSAPGRTEVGGNHTDHQLGHVLAASVNLDIIAAARPNESSKIRIKSEGYEMVVVDISTLTPQKEEENTTAALIRGIAATFIHLGYPVMGFDASMTSNVLKGSGLSSSAAFEVMVGVIINQLFCNGTESAIKIAQIGQYAENVFFNKPCGLMDQMASSVGGFVAIDFHDHHHPEVEKIDFDFASCGYALCIIDTGGNHADLTPDYAAIPNEMKMVAEFFGKTVLSQVAQEDIYKNAAAIRAACGDRALLRAIHFYNDDQLAVSEANHLKAGDFDSFKNDILTSGLSSYRYLQNVYSCQIPQEQGLSVGLALCEKLLENGAYRVHGGGFAGTIQAFVPTGQLESFKSEIEKVFGLGNCHVLSIRPVGGIELL